MAALLECSLLLQPTCVAASSLAANRQLLLHPPSLPLLPRLASHHQPVSRLVANQSRFSPPTSLTSYHSSLTAVASSICRCLASLATASSALAATSFEVNSFIRAVDNLNCKSAKQVQLVESLEQIERDPSPLLPHRSVRCFRG